MTEPGHASIWRLSLPGRLCARMSEYARFSLIAAFFNFLRRQYLTSALKRALAACFGGPSRQVASSRIYALLRRPLLAFHRLGRRVRPIWPHSDVVRLTRRIHRSPALRNSLLFRRGTFTCRHFFLLLFTLYLPLDVFFRQVVEIEFIAANWDEVFLLFCFAYLLFSPLISGRPALSSATLLDAPLFFFLCLALFLMLTVSPLLGVAFDGWRAVCQFMLWFFIVARLTRSKQDAVFVVSALVLMGLLLALHGIYQFVVATPIPASWVSVREMSVRTRSFSIVGSPNIFGDLMVMLAPLAAALTYIVPKTAVKALFFLTAVCMGLACLFSYSRGAWLGLAVAVLLFTLLRDRRLLVILLLGGIALMFVPEIYNRIAFIFTSDFTVSDKSSGRTARWTQGMTILRNSSPLLGFGLGRFGGAVAMQNQTVDTLHYFYLDNYYMKTLVEMGYLGLGGFLFLLASLLLSGLRSLFVNRRQAAHRAHSANYTLICGLLAGMAGMLAHCFFENIFEVPYMNAYFWAMAALVMVLGSRKAADSPPALRAAAFRKGA